MVVVVVDKYQYKDKGNIQPTRRLDKVVVVEMRLVLWVVSVVDNFMDRKEGMGMGVEGGIHLGCEVGRGQANY